MKDNLYHIDPLLFEFVLKYFQQFMPLSRSELTELVQYCVFRKFDKKEIIAREGEVDNYLNMVVKGLVRKYIRVKKNEVILQLATEGHIVHSEISFLTRTPSEVEVVALEPTLLLSLHYDKMQVALDNFSHGEKLGRLILSGMYVKKDEHLYNRLSKSTRERFMDYLDNHPHMLQRVPQKYLASYLQIKPETFSRLKHMVQTKKKPNDPAR